MTNKYKAYNDAPKNGSKKIIRKPQITSCKAATNVRHWVESELLYIMRESWVQISTKSIFLSTILILVSRI